MCSISVRNAYSIHKAESIRRKLRVEIKQVCFIFVSHRQVWGQRLIRHSLLCRFVINTLDVDSAPGSAATAAPAAAANDPITSIL